MFEENIRGISCAWCHEKNVADMPTVKLNPHRRKIMLKDHRSNQNCYNWKGPSDVSRNVLLVKSNASVIVLIVHYLQLVLDLSLKKKLWHEIVKTRALFSGCEELPFRVN